MAVGEVYEAIFRRTPCFKRRTSVSSEFSIAGDFNLFLRPQYPTEGKNPLRGPHTHTHTHTHARTHARTHTHAFTHARALSLSHTHTHTHTHTNNKTKLQSYLISSPTRRYVLANEMTGAIHQTMVRFNRYSGQKTSGLKNSDLSKCHTQSARKKVSVSVTLPSSSSSSSFELFYFIFNHLLFYTADKGKRINHEPLPTKVKAVCVRSGQQT